MGISWEQFFDLIIKAYDVNQSTIADYLKRDRAAITRLKYKNQKTISLTNTELYKVLFDIENSRSLAYGHGMNNSKLALEVLKEGIKNTGLTDAVKMLDDSDYKKFVMGLLGLIDRNQPITGSKELERNILQNDMECVDNCSEISVPPECKICLCCENWKGNERNAYESINGVEGKCIMFDKNTLSSDGSNCKRFNACYGRVFNYTKFSNTIKMYNSTFR
ncbi:MAG: hypothetical protein HDR25_04880 [Lachnospiraceae bacterium]|nr:hypothetical protein [Lachnospiraceae bacterium]